MSCSNTNECPCPKEKCSNHGKCCQCISKHKKLKVLPFCLLHNNEKDKGDSSYRLNLTTK